LDANSEGSIGGAHAPDRTGRGHCFHSIVAELPIVNMMDDAAQR
jgi:hypothetical protein